MISKEILQKRFKKRGILCNTAKVCQTPFLSTFYATETTNPFLNSIVSANHEKGKEFQAMVKSIYPLLFLLCTISFKFFPLPHFTICEMYLYHLLLEAKPNLIIDVYSKIISYTLYLNNQFI